MSTTILIVEDSSTQQLVIKKSIKMAGFSVDNFVTASHGIEGLEKLSMGFVDLIVCDINMPEMNGIEFISRIKSDKKLQKIPIVVITTEGTESKHHEVISKGAVGFIKKPFTPENIAEVFGKILNKDEKE